MKKFFFIVIVFGLAVGAHAFLSSLLAQTGSAKGRWKIQPVPPKSLRPIICGDRRVEGSEECDDGNRTSGDGCSSECRREKSCLSGYEMGSTGVCIPPTTRPKKPPKFPKTCRNGILNEGEECDGFAFRKGIPPGATCDYSTCHAYWCGDGRIRDGEQCDDGNMVNTDACRNNCQSPRCGDSIVDAPGEQCDDGNTVAGDGCSPACRSEGRSEECACGWEKRLRFRNQVSGARPDIAVDLADNIYVVGGGSDATTVGSVCPYPSRIWIAKYNWCGEELWAQEVVWGSWSYGDGITIGSDGFVYTTGHFMSPAIEGYNILIFKLDPMTGAVIWSQNFDGPGVAPPGMSPFAYDVDRPLDILVDADSNIFVAGKVTTSIEDPPDPEFPPSDLTIPWVGKFRENPAGTGADLLAQYTFDVLLEGRDYGEAEAIALNVEERSVFVTGWIDPPHLGFLQKLSAVDLSPLWAEPVLLTGDLISQTLKLYEGTLYVAGYKRNPRSDNRYDGWIGFFNPDTGDQLRDHQFFNGPANQKDMIYDLQPDSGALYITGTRSEVATALANDSGDVWTARLLPDTLEIAWQDTIAGSLGITDKGSHLVQDSSGRLNMVGQLHETSLSEDCICASCQHAYIIRQYCPAEIP